MLLLSLFAALAAQTGSEAPAPPPVIDMHMHAWTLQAFGGNPPPGCIGARGIDMHGVDPAKPFDFMAQATCKVMVDAPRSDDALLNDTLKEMRRFNIVSGVLAGDSDVVAKWMAAAPDRFIPAANFFVDDGLPPAGRVADLEQRVKSGEAKLFAEITAQYRGFPPDHPALEPFYAMAERLDIPVGIHMGYGAPGGPYWLYPKYRASLGNPLLLEDLLARHPRLRVYVMHAGMPMTDEMIALLYSHPQVYVDISADNVAVPRPEFYVHLRRLVEAGYGKRIMFGSDQMVWPQTIAVAVDSITDAPFLSEEQKRDILYNNAARFLRLSKEQIDRHHGR
ncbi:amidohydrolase family protein [Sphingomonas sp. LaA6.9]|uniref:amidohydrolase family protein n=1 Tax=Sphingomonas sp. LaA6.9 TaxID=2919914 RepID=UPI001F4F8956|nr:amidohydrolase family protein [Sphingomonas sp. LaA6.9]MCJ8156000.1 amidohydrolase family protein [Sphingomonas sp. LaA6.9]